MVCNIAMIKVPLSNHLLGGDLGGTKTLLALARLHDGQIKIVCKKRYESSQFDNFTDLLSHFLSEFSPPNARLSTACFSIAGPIESTDDHQQGRLTHLPWELDATTLESQFKIGRVVLINDLAGFAYALEVTPEEYRVLLQPGQIQGNGARLIAAPGTGFNSAIICHGQGTLEILPAESGHASFSPANKRQLALMQFIFQEQSRCTREQVLSGPAIPLLLKFYRQQSALKPSDNFLAELRTAQDPAAFIGKAAVSGKEPLAAAVIRLYVELLAGQLADLALMALPVGGVFLAGGIPSKILPFLQENAFLKAFQNRPPMQHLLEALPITVLLDDEAGLRGALEVAKTLIK